MGERHKDVLFYIQQAVVELDKTEVKLDTVSEQSLRIRNLSQSSLKFYEILILGIHLTQRAGTFLRVDSELLSVECNINFLI